MGVEQTRMLTPTTARDWAALIVITLLGIAALVWLLPLCARWPLVMPPDLYDRMLPIKKPFAGIMNFTPVVVGIAVVTVCLLLYGGWMEWSLRRPIGPPSRRK